MFLLVEKKLKHFGSAQIRDGSVVGIVCKLATKLRYWLKIINDNYKLLNLPRVRTTIIKVKPILFYYLHITTQNHVNKL